MAGSPEYRYVELSLEEALWHIGLFLVGENHYVMGNMIIRMLSDDQLQITKRMGDNKPGSERTYTMEQLIHTIGDQEYIISVAAGQLLVRKRVPIITHHTTSDIKSENSTE